MFLFNCLGPAEYDLNSKCANLMPQDQPCLTLIKQRCPKEDVELSLLFYVSESIVSRILNTWVNYIYFQLNDLNVWPSIQVVDWLIDRCLTSSEQFFSYIQDENIKKFKRHGTRNKERWWVGTDNFVSATGLLWTTHHEHIAHNELLHWVL
jgi:hypothetical protein